MNDTRVRNLLRSSLPDEATLEFLGNILLIDWTNRSTLRTIWNQLIFTENQAIRFEDLGLIPTSKKIRILFIINGIKSALKSFYPDIINTVNELDDPNYQEQLENEYFNPPLDNSPPHNSPSP